MSPTVAIQLEKPITLVKLLDVATADSATPSSEAMQAEQVGQQKEDLMRACQVLQHAIRKVNDFQDNMFKGHKEQIARLSVEIAGKILMQKVEKGDYEIESIVKETLQSAPTRQDVVVHLNPDDLVQCQKIQQESPDGDLAGIKFVADPNVGRAECILETPKGIVESFINNHLEQISEALKKVQ